MNEGQEFIDVRRGKADFGVAMLSFDEVAAEKPKPAPSQDALVVNTERKTYAVFDGVGKYGDEVARDASRAAARILSTFLSESDDELLLGEPRLMLDCVSERVALALGERALTTGLAVKVLKSGDTCAWKGANVGDVRAYLVAHDEHCTICHQLTVDEVDEAGNLTNVLGDTGVLSAPQKGVDCAHVHRMTKRPHFGRARRDFFGEVSLKNNEMIISLNGNRPFSLIGFTRKTNVWLALLSDGVYSELENDEYAIAEAIFEEKTLTMAATRLTHDVATALDDRTAVVVKLR